MSTSCTDEETIAEELTAAEQSVVKVCCEVIRQHEQQNLFFYGGPLKEGMAAVVKALRDAEWEYDA